VALFLRGEGFFRLADVDLATAFPFPTFADVVSGLFFFATIKFLQKSRFTAGSWISSGFPTPLQSSDQSAGTCAWRKDQLPIMCRMRHFIFRWFVTAFAVFVAAPIVGIDYTGIGCLLGASLLLGIINAFVRPILLFLSIPLILVTLGFFILVINALMLKFVSEIVPCFKVHGFWSAIFGAIIISFVSWLMSAFFRGSDGRVHVLTHHSQIKQVRGRVIEPGE
jgi:putative membrane protein